MKNSSEYKNMAKNTIALFFSNFSSKLLSFFMLPLYTSVLSTADYGLTDLSYTSVNMLYTVLTLMIADAIMRFGLSKNTNHTDLLQTGIYFHCGSSILVLIGGVGLSFILQDNDFIRILPYTIIYYYVFTMESVMVAFSKSLNKVIVVAIAGLIATIASITSMIVTLLWLKIGIEGYMISIIIGQLSSSVIMIFGTKAWRYLKFSHPNKSLIRDMIAYSIPVMITQVGWWVNSYGSRYVVRVLSDNSTVGVITAAMKIPTILTMVSSIFIQAWKLSAISEYERNKESSFFNEMFEFFNTILLLASGILMLLSLPLGRIMLKGDFIQGWFIIPFFLLGTMFNGTGAFIGALFNAGKRTKDLVVSTLIGAAVNVALGALLFHLVGLIGVAIASAVSYFVISEIRNFQAKKIIGYSFGKNKRVLGSYLIMVAIAVFSSLSSWIRYPVGILGILCILGINYNCIKRFIGMIIDFIRKRRWMHD